MSILKSFRYTGNHNDRMALVYLAKSLLWLGTRAELAALGDFSLCMKVCTVACVLCWMNAIEYKVASYRLRRRAQ